MATIMVDAGHGGFDNGAMYNGRAEKDDNLELALAVGQALENLGQDVLYTRTTDIYQNPNEKARIANESGADYFISFHRNSSPNPNTYSGVETLIYDESGTKADIADNINAELAALGFNNLGIDIRKDLAVLRRTRMPALLVETGFINTDVDNTLFDAKFNQIAEAIARGVVNTLEGTPTAAQEVFEEETLPAYRIQTGLFRNKQNAVNLQRNLQEDGYEAVILPMQNYLGVFVGGFDSYQDARKEEQRLIEDGYETLIITF